MQTKNIKLPGPATDDNSLPRTTIFLEDEELANELQVDASELYIVPFNYLCTVHSKLYNSSALNLLRLVFKI